MNCNFAFCIFNFAFICYAKEPQHIRVAVFKDATSLSLKVKGSYEILDASGRKVLLRGKNLKTTITIYGKAILIANKYHYSDSFLIKPHQPQAIIINGRNFRGNICFIRKDNRILAVNHIELESYIKGILYHEVSHYWPNETLKAQSIICRTYALYQIGENKGREYDVTSDVYSQVYGGRTSERYRTNRAVEETKGVLLTYQEKVFPAYFHATCGGHTEDASILWNINLPPLKGTPCNFCKDSVHFNWHLVFTEDEVVTSLAKSGYKIKNIKDILILGYDKSGRIKELKIITDAKEITLSAKDFRNIIGPNLIRSTNFKVSKLAGDLVFEGLGWGHGVGLCQWGAYFMAKLGYTTEQILKYYYPGSSLTRNP